MVRTLAVIPARGGSKGIPRKNIRPLCGKPLIAWTIEQAQAVPEISRLICSTEDEEIAQIARDYGCDVPFLRPDDLAGDTASGIDVLLHAIQFFKENGEDFDTIVNLQCTSPLRTSENISNALKNFENNKNALNLISVCQAEHSPYWMYKQNDEGHLLPFLDSKYSTTRRQDLPNVYRPNGAIYISDIKNFLKTKNFKEPAPIPFVMTPEKSVDIDEEQDLKFIEFLMQNESAG